MKELSKFSQMFLESLCEEHRQLLKGYLQHLEESYRNFQCPICKRKLGVIEGHASKELYIKEFFECLMKHKEDNPEEYWKFSMLIKLEEEFEREHDTS